MIISPIWLFHNVDIFKHVNMYNLNLPIKITFL
jgi:hypothetical protein